MDNYEVICQIGKGNFGSISKIIRKSDQRVLVWKELDYGHMSEKEKQQIVSEVNILRELKHPNIVRYYDRIIDKKHSKIYIIMEYCERGDLGQLIKRCKKTKEHIAEDVIWKIFTQIVLALQACHKKKEGKVLHRDIKPSNIFLDSDNNVKLGDFGLSRVLSNESNFAYSHVGTPYYMSPEQIDEMRYNEKSDIWSLGCFLYEITTFNPPFEAKNHVMLAMRIKSGKVEKINSRYSEELWRVISWMLNVNQENRPSIDDLLNVPQVCLRIREKRIKDNIEKLKLFEDNLKKKEEELKKKQIELDTREKVVKEKEEALIEKEKNINELSKKMSSISTNYTNTNSINNNNNELGMLISYGSNNNINSMSPNINSSEDFSSLAKIRTSINKFSNNATFDEASYYPNVHSSYSLNQCNSAAKFEMYSVPNSNLTSTANLTPSKLYQKPNSNRSFGNMNNNGSSKNINGNMSVNEQQIQYTNYLHRNSYDLVQSNSNKNVTSNTSSKTHFNFKFDPSIYTDNLVTDDGGYSQTSSSLRNMKMTSCSNGNEIKSKKVVNTKRASTPKIGLSTNRNYINPSNTLNSTRNAPVLGSHNTPQRHVSSTNYYYSKYINSTQKSSSNGSLTQLRKSTNTSINHMIEHNSNRGSSRGRKIKIPNK